VLTKLLDTMAIAGIAGIAGITANALHCQRGTAQYMSPGKRTTS